MQPIFIHSSYEMRGDAGRTKRIARIKELHKSFENYYRGGSYGSHEGYPLGIHGYDWKSQMLLDLAICLKSSLADYPNDPEINKLIEASNSIVHTALQTSLSYLKRCYSEEYKCNAIKRRAKELIPVFDSAHEKILTEIATYDVAARRAQDKQKEEVQRIELANRKNYLENEMLDIGPENLKAIKWGINYLIRENVPESILGAISGISGSDIEERVIEALRKKCPETKQILYKCACDKSATSLLLMNIANAELKNYKPNYWYENVGGPSGNQDLVIQKYMEEISSHKCRLEFFDCVKNIFSADFKNAYDLFLYYA